MFSQNKEILNSRDNDSILMLNFSKSAEYFYAQQTNADSILKYSKNAIAIAKKYNFKESLCKSYIDFGIAFLIKGELDSAEFYFSNSHKLSKEINNKQLEISSLLKQSILYEKRNDLKRAMELGLQALKKAEEIDDKKLLVSSFYKIAYTYALLDDNEKYKEYLDKAYSIISENDIVFPVTIKSGIYTSLVDYFEQKRFNNPENKENIDSIFYYADKGIVYSKSVNRVSSLVYLLGEKGKLYFLKGNTLLAKQYYSEALDYKAYLSEVSILSLYNKLAYVYIEEGNQKKALSLKDSIVKSISKESSFYNKAERYHLAYYICKTAKKYDLALEYHEKMTDFFDKAKQEEQIKAINELEIKYETQKKEAELIAQKLENETIKSKSRTNYFIIGVLGLLGISFLGFLYYNKKNKALESEVQLAKAKATLHRSQLNPHFISNSINSIYPFLYDKSDPNQAAAYLSDLSQMIRSILDSTFETNWTIKEEIEFIKQYCNIQKLKIDGEFRLDIECDKLLNVNKIPSLITQTFVENTFIHGFTNLEKDSVGVLKIQVFKENEFVCIRILDNGKVDTTLKKNNHISRSTEIVEKRIESTYSRSKLPNDFLTYGKVENGYEVCIKLPIDL